LSQTFLLDTHALLWFDLAPGNLSDPALAVMRDRRNRIFVSAMTALEIAIKFRLGKLPQAESLILDYEASLLRYGFEELPLSGAQAARIATLDNFHPDPFGRVLAAQALELKVPLVTRDPVFDTFDGLKTVW
jgi:PIN domain nuclease of toxin-antitoxin system